MKVFEVITEYCIGDSKEITRSTEYVTAKDNKIMTVVLHMDKHCEQYEKELISIRDVLTIVRNIGGIDEN